MELTYTMQGDYRLPNLIPPESPKVGKYGMLRHSYLRKHREGLYTGMLMKGNLNAHLEEVDREANRMLAKVHEGRYHRFRSDDKGKGNKRGLELKVHDNRCPEAQGRSVSMLSGGEKFLVSLALSIGLSTVAQRGGVQIEALFIDEGFGSLDSTALDNAVQVLQQLSDHQRTIGIISHVSELAERFEAQLQVEKSENGSHVICHYE